MAQREPVQNWHVQSLNNKRRLWEGLCSRATSWVINPQDPLSRTELLADVFNEKNNNNMVVLHVGKSVEFPLSLGFMVHIPNCSSKHVLDWPDIFNFIRKNHSQNEKKKSFFVCLKHKFETFADKKQKNKTWGKYSHLLNN